MKHIFLLFICVFGLINSQRHILAQDDGICARVRVHLSQDVTLTRTEFKATLEITDTQQSVKLENVKVTLNITDADQKDASSVFGVKGPVLSNIGAVDGTGIIQ